ncbi:MAG TPA: peroxiredoxin [Rhizomicrobium sp.]|nr:peroxiredoxin [Rhizomicrobium sp.]
MKKLILAGLFAAACAAPAWAAMPVGETAPDFTLKGSLAGKDFTFNLKTALAKGPVVVYFFPSAFTGGCDAEAHALAEDADQFAAAGASIIGVSADSVDRLHKFSADPAFCAGKFPVASDADTKVAASYKLEVRPARPGAKDNKGQDLDHAFIERVTYVIGRDGKVLATMSSTTDKLSPVEHVEKSLTMVKGLKK